MDFFSAEQIIELFNTHAVPFGIQLITAILVFFFGRLIARLIVRIVRKLLERAKVDDSLRKFLCDLTYALLLMVIIIATLEQLGVQTTAAVAVLGAAGLAVGLALQGSLGNFASGVLIIGFRPYNVGDYVKVAGHEGVVEAIKIFNTVIHTLDNQKIIVPNGKVTDDSIVNVTALPHRRVDLVMGIGYGDDIDKARDVMMKVLQDNNKVLAEPAPQVAVSELGDSSVNFVVRPWCNTADYWDVMFEVTEGVKKALDANGISIPFPQRDVHLHQVA